MASVKATLTVCLKANDVVVAELEDPALWQRVLAAINLGDSTILESPQSTRAAADLPIEKNGSAEKSTNGKENGNGNGHVATASWPGPKEWSAWTDQVK